MKFSEYRNLEDFCEKNKMTITEATAFLIQEYKKLEGEKN